MSKSYIFDVLKTGKALYKSHTKGLFISAHTWPSWSAANGGGFLGTGSHPCVYNMGSLKSMKFALFLKMVHKRSL